MFVLVERIRERYVREAISTQKREEKSTWLRHHWILCARKCSIQQCLPVGFSQRKCFNSFEHAVTLDNVVTCCLIFEKDGWLYPLSTFFFFFWINPLSTFWIVINILTLDDPSILFDQRMALSIYWAMNIKPKKTL